MFYMPVKMLFWFLQNRFISIILFWQDGKYWRKVAHVKLSTISLSYGVSLESDNQHNFFELKDTTLWLYFLYVNRPNFQIVWRSDTQSVYCNVEWDKLGKSFFVRESTEFPNYFAIWHPKCLLKCSVRQIGKIILCREFYALNSSI